MCPVAKNGKILVFKIIEFQFFKVKKFDLGCFHILSNLTATSLRIEHFSVFRVPSQSHRIRHTFALSLSAFAVELPTSKNFSTGSKILQLAAQSPWSRTAAFVGSQCIRHQIDGDCAANPRRLQYDSGECTETALRIILGITEMT